MRILTIFLLLSSFLVHGQEGNELADKILESKWEVLEPDSIPLYRLGDFVTTYKNEVLVYTREEDTYKWVLVFDAQLKGSDLYLTLKEVSPVIKGTSVPPGLPEKGQVFHLQMVSTLSGDRQVFIPAEGKNNKPQEDLKEGL